ncbi:RING finger protein 157-like protein [Leptotrombidium deliense]|uniref:RING-type E3 ubiquitin transferase n=1 Tax=Leptotrombidium deliense TaxID=299467 RepID=A0A443STX5_9ACAR|nr:RING finger protein 157-like protein [Leptotrombidium deliense]
MGNIMNQRQNPRIEEVDSFANNNAYLYPPKFGNYFSTHFIMGGERFESCQPEAYLFGENMDLNFLGGKPTPFPYSAPLPHEPTRTLRSLINIRKESLRLLRITAENKLDTDSNDCASNHQNFTPSQNSGNIVRKPPVKYNIEFTFDADVKCSITIYYMCSEEITSSGIVYTPRDPSRNSETYFFKKGANQQFSQCSHVFDPSIYDEDDLMYRAFDEQGNFDVTVSFPIVIQCVAQEGEEPRQSHSLIAVVEKNNDNSYSIKPFKQKMFIDGLCYLFQEIYGIENKNVTTVRNSENNFISPDDEIEDNGSECVICMSDSRDTLILPCRHLCLCYACADSLRYQANNCPICRSPFRALLQIKAVRKSLVSPLTITATPPAPTIMPHHHHQLSASTNDLVDVPPGYEPISLIEALNGPLTAPPSGNHGMYCFRRSSEEGALSTPTSNRKLKPSRKLKNVAVENAYENSRRDEKSTADEKWRLQNRPRHLILSENSADSSTSSSNSETAGNSIQERIRLLAHERDEESEENGELMRKESLDDETEMTAFKMITPVKESHTDLSPLSVGVSSGSFPILSLRDGIDEQRYMVETDLMSVTTAGSVPNILKEDDPNFYPTDNLQVTSTGKLFLKKQMPTVAKLAESEVADDLDLSPVED